MSVLIPRNVHRGGIVSAAPVTIASDTLLGAALNEDCIGSKFHGLFLRLLLRNDVTRVAEPGSDELAASHFFQVLCDADVLPGATARANHQRNDTNENDSHLNLQSRFTW